MKKNDTKVIRIIDANANRAREGMRVCEDIVRFIFDHARYAAQLKKVRHSLTAVVVAMPITYRCLLEERESSRDVGKTSVLYASKKENSTDLFVANMKRAQEAVRVLEEFSKVYCRSASSGFQEIRFQLYQLEKKIILRK